MSNNLTMTESLWLSSQWRMSCPHCGEELDVTINNLFFQMGVKHADGRHDKGGWGSQCPHCKGKIRMNITANPTKWTEDANDNK